MKAKIITKEIMDYVYEKNGWLYWKNDVGVRGIKDSLAGSLNKSTGYYVVQINGKIYYNHRILYQFYENVILTENDVIDHHNRNKSDNRKENLMLCDQQENTCNRKVHKNNLSTGLKNIYIRTYYKKNNRKVYSVQIQKGSERHTKEFDFNKFSLEDVIKYRDKKLLELHGEFANINTLVILK